MELMGSMLIKSSQENWPGPGSQGPNLKPKDPLQDGALMCTGSSSLAVGHRPYNMILSIRSLSLLVTWQWIHLHLRDKESKEDVPTLFIIQSQSYAATRISFYLLEMNY